MNNWAARDKALEEAQQKQMEEEQRHLQTRRKSQSKNPIGPVFGFELESRIEVSLAEEEPVLSNKNMAKFAGDRDARMM